MLGHTLFTNHDIAQSLWVKTAPKEAVRAPLEGTLEADIVIIGAGYTGLSTALHLACKGASPLVLDAQSVGWGASGRAGGQVNPALPVATPDLLFSQIKAPFAKRLAKLSLGSADFLFDMIKRHQIACEARQKGWLRAHHSKKARANAAESALKWRDFGADHHLCSRAETLSLSGSPIYRSAMLAPHGGLVHPLKLAQGLARTAEKQGAMIYEHSPVIKIEKHGKGWRLHTANGHVTCRFVVHATNAYSGTMQPFAGAWQKQLHQEIVRASPIQIATDPLPDEIINSILPDGHSISDSRRMIMYARREPDNRIIYGSIGTRRRDGSLSGYDWLAKDAVRVFPQLRDVKWPYRWGGQIALTENRLPHLIKLDESMIAGMGYNGRGVAMANVMGKVLSDYASGVPEEALDLPVTGTNAYRFGAITQSALTSYIHLAKYLDRLES